MDAETRLYEFDVAGVRVVATGIDVDLVTETCKGTGEFAYVDVHSPAVAGSGLG
jgi:hypothetical protein